jgi:hypothetical protein
MLSAKHQLIQACAEFEVRPWRRYCASVRTLRRRLSVGVSAPGAKRLRQIAAEETVIAAGSNLVGRRALRASLSDVEALGYSSLSKRVVVACVVAQWSAATKAERALAEGLIEQARKHLRFLRRTRPARTSMSQTLDENERRLGARHRGRGK